MNRLLVVAVLILTLQSCSSSGNKKPVEVNTADTGIPIPADSNVPVDTDDHNKAGVSDIALDSPIGPHDLNDTLRTNH